MTGIGDILLFGLSTVGNVLDTPGAMLRNTLAGENPLVNPFTNEGRVSGRELLERAGLADPNTDQGWIPDAGDIAGFGVELATDPLNLLGLGAIGKTAKAAQRAKVANAYSQKLRAARAMPEELIEHLHPAAVKKGVYSIVPGREVEAYKRFMRDIGHDQSAIDAVTAGDKRIGQKLMDDLEYWESRELRDHPFWMGKAVAEGVLQRADVPRTFWHGSPTAGLSASDLDPAFAGTMTDGGWYGRGTYFSPKKSVAKEYLGIDDEVLEDQIAEGVVEGYVPKATGRPLHTGSLVPAFLDVRNPVDARDIELVDGAGSHQASFHNSLMRRAGRPRLEAAAKQAIGEKNYLMMIDSFTNDSAFWRPVAGKEAELTALLRQHWPDYSRDDAHLLNAASGFLEMQQAWVPDTGFHKHTWPRPAWQAGLIERHVPGAENLNPLSILPTDKSAGPVTDILRELGHDASMVPGKEMAVFDRSQIYEPRIAPRLQDVPQYGDRIKALLLYNALARGGSL